MTKVILLKTRTCIYCPATSRLWQDLKNQYNFDYEEIDATTPKGQELVMKFSIMAVPTTIIERNGKQSVAFVGIPPREKAVQVIGG
ncbi:MAG: thioredoxin family protein [Candidatus Aenigmarchaeota archaeon]|nr:thioredoxin family protein [Candidatus Aenigmarchaeota archaeon]